LLAFTPWKDKFLGFYASYHLQSPAAAERRDLEKYEEDRSDVEAATAAGGARRSVAGHGAGGPRPRTCPDELAAAAPACLLSSISITSRRLSPSLTPVPGSARLRTHV